MFISCEYVTCERWRKACVFELTIISTPLAHHSCHRQCPHHAAHLRHSHRAPRIPPTSSCISAKNYICISTDLRRVQYLENLRYLDHRRFALLLLRSLTDHLDVAQFREVEIALLVERCILSVKLLLLQLNSLSRDIRETGMHLYFHFVQLSTQRLQFGAANSGACCGNAWWRCKANHVQLQKSTILHAPMPVGLTTAGADRAAAGAVARVDAVAIGRAAARAGMRLAAAVCFAPPSDGIDCKKNNKVG